MERQWMSADAANRENTTEKSQEKRKCTNSSSKPSKRQNPSPRHYGSRNSSMTSAICTRVTIIR
eukprot:scaffold16571_cov76-Attheya_sp.AAC.9